MRAWRLVLVVPVVLTIALSTSVAADQDSVPLFTSDDLDRMFGPAPATPSDPVDKSRPEDWRWVEEFLARQYSRIDADRQFELSSRTVDIAAERVEQPWPVYGGPVAWGLGYPASTWWNGVWSKYASATGAAPCHPRDYAIHMARNASHDRGHRGSNGRGRGTLNSKRSTRMR